MSGVTLKNRINANLLNIVLNELQEIFLAYKLADYEIYQIVTSDCIIIENKREGIYLSITSKYHNKRKKASIMLMNSTLRRYKNQFDKSRLDKFVELGGKKDVGGNVEISFTNLEELKSFIKEKLIHII